MAVLAAAPGLPSRSDLATELSDGVEAQRRGYYLPDEDERLRESFHRYLAVRVSLWEAVQSLLPIVDRNVRAKKLDFYRSYGIALCASAMLWRTGHALLDLAQGRDVVWQKLDEAEPRFGIERKTFTYMYEGLTAPKVMAKYRKSWRFYRRHAAQIHEALSGDPFEAIIPLLQSEAGFAPPTLRGWLGERVTDSVRARVLEFCKPGDVFITRHDDALSNVFLPGYWPHGALYLGNAAQRAALGLPHIETARHHNGARIVFIESKKTASCFALWKIH